MSGPHIPMTTSAGHFLSMQPSTDPREGPEKVWYRGDCYAAKNAQMHKYKGALVKIMELFDACVDEPTTMMLMAEVAEEALK